MKFKLVSNYQATGDQPEAIKQLTDGLNKNMEFQTLLGVTGSGKTFTIANVIANVDRPTLVLSHNKTLAAQLYAEFKQFFPDNLVEYFVSYYDYYQPEAYIPATGVYIEKDLSINQEIEKLRLNTTSSLLSGRRDVIVVSSVSCIYGIGNPREFNKGTIDINIKDVISIDKLIKRFIDSLYSRSMSEFTRGKFRVKGDTIDIFASHTDTAYRISFWGDEVEEIEEIDPSDGRTITSLEKIRIFPANIFLSSKDRVEDAMKEIQKDLKKRIIELDSNHLDVESKRLEERVNFDVEMIKELGYCSGIENYSRYFDGREAGSRPFCLLDYFPDDFLTIMDESHVTAPQIRAMYGGDRSRKMNLVEHGFRLPSALDNRPLKFEEWETINKQTIFMSATPAKYELERSNKVVVEQIIRPTGLLEPEIKIRATKQQIEDIINEINIRIANKERTIITTLTKKMAEELTKYLTRFSIKCRYIHSEVDTLDRIEIIQGLREGLFDVLIGVNLLREGLDLPEVSLVCILDADKEGFLRSERSLIQTAGRAARHINGSVIMYADKITESMAKTIKETKRRRMKQKKYNEENNIVIKPIIKEIDHSILDNLNPYSIKKTTTSSTDRNISHQDIKKKIRLIKYEMEKAAKSLDFAQAIKLRDEMLELKKIEKSN